MRFAPKLDVLNLNPLVAMVEEVLPPEHCAELIDHSRDSGKMQRATVLTEEFSHKKSKERTNWSGFFRPQTLPHVPALLLRIGMILRLPVTHAEGVSVLHYLPGQEFTPHYDGHSFERAPEVVEKMEASGGQRLFTTILYLNDVAEGGATDFPELGLSVPPRCGRLLIFANTLAGQRERASLALHAGRPVVEGEKWAATIWWREAPYRPEFEAT